MNDKKITKKWWFWVIVVLLVLGVFGAFAQPDTNVEKPKGDSQQPAASNSSTLSVLNTSEYKGKEGLVVYKELKTKGYNVNAEFDSEALTDMNGKASDLFEKLDANSTEDRQSVDAYVVDELVQDGDNIILSITLQPVR